MSPQLRTLTISALVALAAAIVLAVIAASEAQSYRGEETAAAMLVWSNFLLVVTVVTAVGALVLSGVERALRR